MASGDHHDHGSGHHHHHGHRHHHHRPTHYRPPFAIGLPPNLGFELARARGVAAAALVMGATGWLGLAPAVSRAVALVIALGTWGLLREAMDLALDAVPAGIDRGAVEAYLAGLPGVVEVHDLHIWGMSTTETALTVHLVRPAAGVDDALLAQASRALHDRFGIAHATFQFEVGHPAFPCRLASPHVV